MRYVIGLIVLAIIFRDSLTMPALHPGVGAAGQTASLGTILVGLCLCLPAFGFVSLMRSFYLWRRSFHERMRRDGVMRRGRPDR